jgi:hypothetical protein
MSESVTVPVREYFINFTEEMYERTDLHQWLVDTAFPNVTVLSFTRTKTLPDLFSKKVHYALLVRGYEKP